MKAVIKKNKILPWSMLLVALLVAAAASYILVRLVESAVESNQADVSLANLKAISEQLNAYEWQAIARHELNAELAGKIDAANNEMDGILADLSRPGTGFQLPADVVSGHDRYRAATAEEFRLLESGQFDAAAGVDASQVDPAFDSLDNSIAAATTEFEDRSAAILRRTYIGSTITAVSAALIIGLLFWRFEHVQRNTELMKERDKLLSQSEQRLRSLIEKGADIISILDESGNILFASPSIKKVLGYQPASLIKTNVFGMVYPDDAHRLKVALARLVETGNPSLTEKPVEFRFRHADGSWRVLEGAGSNMLSDPNVGGLVVNVRDVTERNRAGEQIRASEERYRTLAEAAQEDIFIFDREGRCLYANDFFSRKFGLTPRDMIGRPAGEKLPVTFTRLQERFVSQVFETGEPVQLDIKLPGAREPEWVETSLTPVREDSGDISAVLGIARGINEIIAMQKAQQRASEALEESERRYRNLLELLPDGTVAVDLTGKLLYANSQAARMHGFDSVEKMVAANMLDFVVPEERRRAADTLKEMASRGKAGKIENEEFTFLRKDGSRFPAEVNAAPAAAADGRPMVISTIRDISERKLVEDEMQRMADDLSLISLLNDASNRGDSIYNMLELMTREMRAMFGCSAAGVCLMSDDGADLCMRSFLIPPARLNLLERVVAAKLKNMNIRVKLEPGLIHARLMEQTQVKLFSNPGIIEKVVSEYANTMGLERFVTRILPIMNINSILAISLVGKEGPVGMLGFASDGRFPDSDVARIRSITEHLSVIVERRLAEEALRKAS